MSSPNIRCRLLALVAAVAMLTAACASDDAESATTTAPAETEAEVETTEVATTEAITSVRDSGITVTVQPAGDLIVHSLTAPEEVFANSTHIIETENSLVLIDTQFLLPNALDVRAYADDLGKPIDRVFITHEHPDHFLGSEAFADVPVYSLASTSAVIAEVGDAEVAEKQGDFGEAIAGSFVVPEVVEPGSLEIDGVTFEVAEVDDAEAETQLVLRVPEQGIIVTGDLIYSGVHLILAGPADTWSTAITDLAADAADYPIVLAGHGLPAGPEVFDTNLAYLGTVLELLGTVDNAADFKQALIDTYPELGMEAAIDFGAPFLFPDEGAAPVAGEVAFGECAELSTGTVVPLEALQAQLPDGVTALSLTAQGTVFDGSDDLGVLITRTLQCEDITVTTADGESVSDGTHIAHVGTPVDASTLPASPYNNDGVNGADFNNYIFGYYSDSAAYVAAMDAAGVTGTGIAAIMMTDVAVEDCVVDRGVTVDAGAFAFNAEGQIPDASCEDPVVPFIANWWSVNGENTAVVSNNIPGQAAIFIDTAETVVSISAVGADMTALIGPDPVVADAFGVIGLIPASDGNSMTMTAAS